MRNAGARFVGAVVGLAAYYWILFGNPVATSLEPAEAQLQQDIEASLSLFEAGRFTDALPPTQRLAEQWPNQAIVQQRLALIFQKIDRAAEEVRAWEAFIAASPTPIDACPMLAEAYRRNNRADLALEALERCAGLRPANPDFLVLLGQELLKANRPTEARRAFERGLEIDAAHPDLHLQLGIRQFAERRFMEARASFERFLALAPTRRDEVAIWLERTERTQ